MISPLHGTLGVKSKLQSLEKEVLSQSHSESAKKPSSFWSRDFSPVDVIPLHRTFELKSKLQEFRRGASFTDFRAKE